MIIGLVGALTGLVNAALPEALTWFKNRQAHKQEIELLRLNAELAAQQYHYDLQVAEVQADAAQMEAVYSQASAQRTDNWVDKLNALMRPTITILFVGMFCACVTAMILQSTAMGAGLQGSLLSIFPMVEGFTTHVVTYWFGRRPLDRRK